MSGRVFHPEYIPPGTRNVDPDPLGKRAGGGDHTRSTPATGGRPPRPYNDASAPPGEPVLVMDEPACVRCRGSAGVVPVVRTYWRAGGEPIRHERGKLCLGCAAELGGPAVARKLGGPVVGDIAELVAALGRSLFESSRPRRTTPKSVKPVMSSRDTPSAVRRGPPPRKRGR